MSYCHFCKSEPTVSVSPRLCAECAGLINSTKDIPAYHFYRDDGRITLEDTFSLHQLLRIMAVSLELVARSQMGSAGHVTPTQEDPK